MTVHLKLILHIPMEQDLDFTKYKDSRVSTMFAHQVSIIDLEYFVPVRSIDELSINKPVLKAMREAILKAYPNFVGLANHEELNNLLET